MKVLRNGKAVEKVDPPVVDISSEAVAEFAASVRVAIRHNAHRREVADMLEALAADRDRLHEAKIPCDVMVAPATIFRKGVRLSTVVDAIIRREGRDIPPLDFGSRPQSRPDPRDALIGTDVSDAAIADATISRLSSDLAAAREALAPFAAYAEWLSHLSDESNVLSFHRGRLDWLHLIAGDFRRARAVLAKLSKGRDADP